MKSSGSWLFGQIGMDLVVRCLNELWGTRERVEGWLGDAEVAMVYWLRFMEMPDQCSIRIRRVTSALQVLGAAAGSICMWLLLLLLWAVRRDGLLSLAATAAATGRTVVMFAAIAVAARSPLFWLLLAAAFGGAAVKWTMLKTYQLHGAAELIDKLCSSKSA